MSAPLDPRPTASHDDSVSRPDATEGTAQSRWLVQLHCERVLGVLVQACDEARIDVVPVKGVVSARTLYDDIADRALCDVDVRVRPRDLPRLLTLARQKQWRIGVRTRSYSNATLFIDGRPIDVETHFGAPGTSSMPIDTLIDRASRTRGVFKFSALVPDAHDHALLLVLNAYKDHMASAMAWAIRDLERVIRAPWLSRELLLARAADAGTSTMLFVVADWMAREMCDAQWADLRRAMGRPPRPLFIAMHQRLEAAGPRGAFALRVLSRFGSDAPARWPGAGLRMAGFQAEAWLSQWGAEPYARGVVIPPATRR